MLHGQVKWYQRQDSSKGNSNDWLPKMHPVTKRARRNEKKERGAKEGVGKGAVNLEKTD